MNWVWQSVVPIKNYCCYKYFMAGKLLLITTLAANIFSELNFCSVASFWMGGAGINVLELFFVTGAFSAITFTSSNNVTVLVRFPAELRCQASIEDNIHIPLIRWYRNDGTPVESYVAKISVIAL